MNRNTLFIRHGFEASDLQEATQIGLYLQYALQNANITEEGITREQEMEWIETLQQSSRPFRIGGETLVDTQKQELPLANIDPYMRGISRWLNALGIHTIGCCDGHNRRHAHVYFKNFLTNQDMKIIQACAPHGVRVRFSGKQMNLLYEVGEIQTLLDMAERLYTVSIDLTHIRQFEAENFKPFLHDLLSISGPSGNERRIRQYLQHKLQRYTDYTYTDRAGNLLAYLYCGSGPTVLLSAHMDTTEDFESDREILENGHILSSSKGILGADDRAGIAVIMEILKRIVKSNFKGTLKVAFTVKEEIGCVGSQEIEQDFLRDVDAAIVVDRRGTRDIVTSNGGTPFCPKGYGELFEEAGILAGMNDWKTTPGGLSDAKVFAQMGIPSVNLSVGYQHEHTDFETLDYKATYQTVMLIESMLNHQLLEKFVRNQSMSKR